jgi:hypothetical protein
VGVLFLLSACASSTTGPGAGAAEGTVKGSVDDINQKAQSVFQQMNIQTTASSIENSGNERRLVGKMGDSNITVQIDKADNATSNVKVDASKNVVSGQQDIAKNILSKIVQQT